VDTSEITGLTSKEVRSRLSKFGYNELPNKEKRNFLKIFYGLLTEPMIFLLLATIAIYFLLGDKKEAGLLLLSVVGIISIELYQENKTEKSLEALRNLSSPISDVIRDGKRLVIPGRELVVGDIIILSEGSRVPADAKLISADNLRVDESLLTGESLAVEKHTRKIKDYRINSVFSGTLVVRGHGIAEVTHIGLETELGQIGTSLKSIETEKTLLQKEVNVVIKTVAILAISASVILTLIYWSTRGNLIQGFLAGLTLAIAILPEEFPIVLTLFLTLGAWRLAKSKVLARRAHTIETLGCASVLCVDKTGTLTENRMKIMTELNHEIIKYGVLASQKKPFDPMEEAFIISGKQAYEDLEKIYGSQSLIKEFALEEQSLSVVHIWGINNKITSVAAKGAPETIFDLCHLGKSEIIKLEKDVKELASRGLRVIAVAKGKNVTKLPQNRHEIDFEFLGLVGLADPIRKEVSEAIKLCHEAGIRVIMITGDYPETAINIAKVIGLDHKTVITGAEFEQLPEEKRKEIIRSVSVFSRVTPSNKLTIVNALKDIGEIVAMTGDGVNDAPALKSAHIGIAMGKRGTDVAREAASIVLLDDNFSSIVDGIRLGRRIYTNLQKAMSYIFSVHVPIALLSLLPVVFGWPLALVPAHIVFLEFIIDPSCTIIFENEKEERGAMQHPPRRITEPIFSKRMVLASILRGIIVAAIVILCFWYLLSLGWSAEKARGMTFLVLVVSNICLVLGIAGKQALTDIFHWENKAMFIILSATIASLVLTFTVPVLREILLFAPISWIEALLGILAGTSSLFGIIPLKKLLKQGAA
jgi:Ca2+-transporting ATPase